MGFELFIPAFELDSMSVKMVPAVVVAYGVHPDVSDMTVQNQRSINSTPARMRAHKLIQKSTDLREHSSRLLVRTQQLLRSLPPLKHQEHNHSCMACSEVWACSAVYCELSFMSICLECHKRLGMIL